MLKVEKLDEAKKFMERREFLKVLTMGGAALAANATLISQALAQTPPGSFAPQNRDAVSHILNRITYGATPDLYQRVQNIGVEAFIEEQLNPDNIDDSHMDAILSEYVLLDKTSAEIVNRYANNRGLVVRNLVGSTISRAIYSNRSLHEVMVAFWSNHFSTYMNKGAVLYAKFADDRDVIRPHALGKFREMLIATAQSPGMLLYLDNVFSTGEDPNENYARELMELHTLGVHGGYTEEDVREVARIFTGWSLIFPEENEDRFGEFIFRRFAHDNGTKVVLGESYRGAGQDEGMALLNWLASQPTTARFIATKLVKRFVSDNPPESLIERVAQSYLDTDTDIPAMLRTIFASDEFWQADAKFKQPMEYLTSTLRILDYQVENQSRFERSIGDWLQTTGHVPFNWATPDGYPDNNEYWLQGLLPRWNLAMHALTETREGAPNFERIAQLRESTNFADDLDFLTHYLIGRSLSADEQAIMDEFMTAVSDDPDERMIAAASLLLASPAFMYR